MFLNYKKIIICIIILFLALSTESCTVSTLKAISYKDAVYKLTDSDKDRFTFVNATNEKIICTFSTNIFSFNSFTFELANDLYKVKVFNNSVRIECPSGRIINSYYNDKYKVTSLSSQIEVFPTDFDIIWLSQSIYSARGIKYIGWIYIVIIIFIVILGLISLKAYSTKLNYRTHNYNRNTKNRVYYGKINYKKRKKSYYNNDYYKNKGTKHKVHANTNRSWYNKEVKTNNNKIPYYIIVNLFILILIGILIYMVFYM